MRGSNSRGHASPADLKSAALDHSANPPNTKMKIGRLMVTKYYF